MERVKEMLKGIWAFCSYVFIPQRRPKGELMVTVNASFAGITEIRG